MKTRFAAIVSLILALTVLFCTASAEIAGAATLDDDPVTVSIAVTSETPELWSAVNDVLAKSGYNITVKAVNLGGADGSPNTAVAYGEADLNAFQHYAYFEANTADQGISDQLTVIGETLIVPLSLFSSNHTDLEELKFDGVSIAIPEDTTNQGRALKVLENAGLLTVSEEAGLNGVIKDIAENPYNIKFTELPGSQLASALPDVDAAIINCGVAVSYGLDPNNDPIYKDDVDLTDPQFKPFINIIVARADEADNPNYQAI
ncbi:MAG: MetQ/NlpA family ABC transporter substrate-binding protein, partial [Clostridia bacterium]|nr:MetQ/NlpA family ABC transporter substrate-binding protein [Clostridia bacterium]